MSGPWGNANIALAQLGHVADIQLGKMLQPAAGSDGDVLVPYLRAGSIPSLSGTDALPSMYASPFDIHRYEVVAGDLIVVEGGDCGQTAFVPPLPSRTIIQNSLHRVRPRIGDIRFVRYALDSIYSTDWLDVLCSKSTFGHLTREKLAALPIPSPPQAVQRAIADYLDRETARIDALIAARRRMVDLLEEQIHSYVDQAVRGCTQSGAAVQLSVIGAVPAIWDVIRARRVASIFSGTTFPHDYQGQPSGDYPLYKVSDLSLHGNETHLNACENWVSADDVTRLRGRVVPPDSVVFPRVGAALLLNARRITTRPSLVDDNSRALHFAWGDARFWRYVMTLIDFGELANPGAVPTIGEEAILSMRIPAPPDHVQRAIADAIDDFRERCDKLCDVSRRQITLLHERRRALVTAAITGEINIPEAA